jgi:hypothetical protein
MKPNSTQQEILLVTGTHFSSRQLCKNEDGTNSGKPVNNEQLEEACWNGILQEMLPEIFKAPANGEKLFLWQVREAQAFLEIELGDLPIEPDHSFSIDPYSFMHTKILN